MSSSSQTNIPVLGLSFDVAFNVTCPDGFITRATTLNDSDVLIAPETKFIDVKTGEVMEIISPSLIVPVVCIIHFEVCGT